MHISPPASNCGGDVLPTSSLILILDGKSDWSVALGCRLNTALPRVMGGGVSVGVVSPETTELELVLGEVEVREAVPMEG
jgi:hypothetical protein